MADEPDVDIKFGAATEGIEEGAERSKEAIDSLKEHVEALKESGEQLHEMFETMLEAAGIEVGIAAFKEWVESSAELGEAMERAGAMLGVTASQASELAGMAKLTGTEFGALEHVMERFEFGLASTDQATSHVAEALRVLGLSARQFIGVPMPQQLERLAEAFSHFADGPAKTAAAMALLGRAGAEMIPFLDKGKEGMEELHDVLERTGAIMSNEMVGSFAKVNEHINEMKLAWQGLSNEIFDVVKGPIDAAIVGFTHLVESLRPDQIRSAMISATQSVGAFAITAGAEFENIRANVKTMAIEFDSAMKLVAEAAHLALAPINALTGGVREMVALMTVASNVAPMLAKAMHDSGGSGAPVAGSGPYGGVGPVPSTPDDPRLQAALNVKAETEAIASYTKTVMDLFGKDPRTIRRGEGEGGPAESGKPGVPQMQLGGGGGKEAKDELAAEITALNSEVEQFKKATAEKEKDLDDLLKHHQISTNSWLSQSTAALEKEKEDVADMYADMLARAGKSAEKRAEIEKNLANAMAAIDNKIKDDQRKATDDITKDWMAVGDQIAGILNSQVDSLLKGTESIQQAFKNMAASVIEDLAKLAIKITVDAALMEALSLATGGAAGGFGSGGFGSWLGSMLHFDEGTDYVQQTGPAIIHQGERITPADQNPFNPANTLGSSGPSSSAFHMGGMTVHNHGQAPDGAKLGRDFIREVQRKGVFAGNTARRYVGV